MSAERLQVAAAEVLERYGFSEREFTLQFLGNRGGFSGARLWRVEFPTATMCLRGWPPMQRLPRRLVDIHQLMRFARGAGLTFVPTVWFTPDRASLIEHTGRLWDLTQWMPGRADFRDEPTARRLEAALTALASLHNVWSRAFRSEGPCPAVQRRLQSYQEWHDLLQAGWQPPLASTTAVDSDTGGLTSRRSPGDLLQSLAERAWRLLRQQLDDVPVMLQPWIDKPVPLQPCLCDIWHDHVLFVGPEVTGIIDYGSTKIDHVAVDLARLLGSMVGDAAWVAGLRAYGSLRPLSADEEALARALDRTGTLLGTANWLKWLYLEQRPFDEPAAVAERLGTLVERMERW